MKKYELFVLIFLGFILSYGAIAQTYTAEFVQELKSDPRGPYRDIKWFCKDGSINDPKVPCGEIGGVQRARYKESIVNLANKHNLYLGQILSTTDFEDFFDQKNDHSRLKQYIIEQYLFNNDEGWIQRKSQYYRGATQVEDEEEWGRLFLTWWSKEKGVGEDDYLLLREAVKAIPHAGNQNSLEKVRALSKDLAESFSKFNDWRIKIHGKPQASDLQGVRTFQDEYSSQMSESQKAKLNDLIVQMDLLYSISSSDRIQLALSKIKKHSTTKAEVESYLRMINRKSDTNSQMIQGIELLSQIKANVLNDKTEKIELLDLFQSIESHLFITMSLWKSETLGHELENACYLAMMSNASGYLHDYEWSEIEGELTAGVGDELDYASLLEVYQTIRKAVLWGGSLLQTTFESDIDKFAIAEPLTHGFIDDRIRSGVLLTLGETASDLQSFLSQKAKWHNDFFGQNITAVQGLNPGYSIGQLYVIEAGRFEGVVDPKGIYVFQEPPSDLDPVGGILSISEGNLVSHLQLLARNLGIPNVSITNDIYDKMRMYNGTQVFIAVSDRGGVVIKSVEDMSDKDKTLFAQKERKEERITVPTDDIVLDGPMLLNLRDVRADASGNKCGPKAANLGELKHLFPDRVVEGLVLPFSVFKSHMDMNIPQLSISYWDYLVQTFTDDRASDEMWVLEQLAQLRSYIKEMQLQPELIADLQKQFKEVLGGDIGSVPVFLRSDTNMEDLPDFTGAGLNLTLFNVLDEEKILTGIKEVWASPYTERSYKWRQKFLLNPENVYPSILIIPSVFVDYSGVVITKDVTFSRPDKLTVAFSRGAGGAVDGQKAETRLLSADGAHRLLSPARDVKYKTLSPTGGTVNYKADISNPILNEDNVKDIWKLIMDVNRQMPSTGMPWPYDIELGFKDDQLWLFQIRPFVENKKALSSEYLLSINPEVPPGLKFNIDSPFL